MSLHLQACSSLRGYGRLWCCGFPYLGLLGSAAFEATVINFVSFCFFLRLGCPPGPVSCGLGWLPVSRLGFAHPGLTSVCGLLFFGGSLFWLPVPFPPLTVRALPRWGFLLFPFSCVLRYSVMALRAFRRTVSLDVSQLASSNQRKDVSTFIVEHFAQHKIHAIQFIATVAKVTFAVEASKQEVISHQAININGVQCAVRGGGPRAQNVLIYNYAVEGPEDPIRRALGAYGVIEEVKFRHWVHMPTVGDGVRIVRMVRREAILRHMSIGEVRVKIAYVGQQQVCNLCDAPGHIARNCPYRNKCFQCGLEGHFSRTCPQRDGFRDHDSVQDPTPTEAAAAVASTAVTSDEADPLDGASVSSAAVAAAVPDPFPGTPESASAGVIPDGPVSQPDVDLDSQYDDDLTSSVDRTPSGSSSMACRDNQLDELSSQPLFTPSASSVEDPDSLQGVTIDSACHDSSASPPPPWPGLPSQRA